MLWGSQRNKFLRKQKLTNEKKTAQLSNVPAGGKFYG